MIRERATRPALVRAVLALEPGVPEELMSPGLRRAIRWEPLLKLFGGRRSPRKAGGLYVVSRPAEARLARA